MKNLLMIMMMVLGTITMNAQGFIGSNLEDLKEYAKKYDLTVTQRTLEDKDATYTRYQMVGDEVHWFVNINENGLIIDSTIAFKNNNVMGLWIRYNNDEYVPMSNILWNSYGEEMVVIITLHPETEGYLPYMHYTYEFY